MFQANTRHPLFREVHNILLKYVGLDRVVEEVIDRMGEVRRVFLVGEFSKGLDSNIIDLIFIGNIDKSYLLGLVDKAEALISRKIRYLIYSEEEATSIDWSKYNPKPLLLWSKD